MNQEPFEVDDAIVLLLGAPSASPKLKDRIEGVTRLEKLLFLLERETPLGELLTEKPEFTGHNFGPFSAKAYQAVDTLASANLITDSSNLSTTTEDSWETQEVIGERMGDAYTTRDFELTERGRRYYLALLEDLPPNTEQILGQFKDQFGALPLRQLIRYVYTRYEEFTDKSIIKDEILKG